MTATRRSASIFADGWADAAVTDTASGAKSVSFPEPIGDAAWIAGGRVLARHDSDGLFHALEAETGMVGTEGLELSRLWVTDAGTRVQAMDPHGVITPLDAADLRPAGMPLERDGWPIWFAKSPDGERVSVSYFVEPVRTADGTLTRIRVDVLDPDDHRVISSEPLPAGGTVILDTGDLIGLEDNRIGRYESDGLSRVGSLTGTAGGLGIPKLSVDGRTLLITAADGSGMLFDLPSGIRIGEPFRMDPGTLGAGHLRPDGLEMALSMPEGVVVWDLDPTHQFDAVCRIAGRELSADEWRTYLSDLGEQVSTCGFD
ncbi:hypothetical protein [Agromyces marinus]|uniref:WD40-like Beta Propeller Repeat n=1 Tax=Agromyces marinus TaxID=1389020 RepID=A0ABM8H5G9_9MICO|nr:hypothetical protein [Agromyces marinus]UIP58976.1 hypothetical protein DSM26151_18670 [Agromyces marinus]BDZ56054.1 hypothetical protein GCM10025870_31270 [Agromyces marinus]